MVGDLDCAGDHRWDFVLDEGDRREAGEQRPAADQV